MVRQAGLVIADDAAGAVRALLLTAMQWLLGSTTRILNAYALSGEAHNTTDENKFQTRQLRTA